jgi:Na+-driven multidrug efflux pump
VKRALPLRYTFFYKKILVLALPIMIQNLLFTLMGFVDNVMVGQLGESVIAALGNALQVQLFLFLLFAALGQGGSILIAQYSGGGEKTLLSRTVSTMIFFGFVIGVFFLTINLFFSDVFIKLLTLNFGESDPLKDMVTRTGGEYLRIVSFSYLLVIPGMMVASALRSMGDTRTPVKIAVFANVVNMVGNYFLIFGGVLLPDIPLGPISRLRETVAAEGLMIPGFNLPFFTPLGFRGAAIATLVSGSLQGGLLLYFMKGRFKKVTITLHDIVTPHIGQLKKIIGIGYPMSIDGLYWQGARIAYTLVFNFIGTMAYASYAIVKTIKGMGMMPIAGLAAGIMILVGQELGRGNQKRARIFASQGILLGLLMMIVPSLLIFFLSRFIVGIYQIEQVTRTIAVVCTMMLGVSLYFTTLNSVVPGILRAGGDTRSVMVITVLSFLCIGGPLAFILGVVFYKVAGLWLSDILTPDQGIILAAVGAFTGISLEEIGKSVIFLRRMKKGLWLRKLY